MTIKFNRFLMKDGWKTLTDQIMLYFLVFACVLPHLAKADLCLCSLCRICSGYNMHVEIQCTTRILVE